RNATRRVSRLSAILLHQEQAGEIAKPSSSACACSATIGTEAVAALVKATRIQLCVFLCLLCGQETHASATQSDPLLLPTRNGRCREDAALHWEYLVSRVPHPPP